MATTIDDLRKGLDTLYDRFADGDAALDALGLLFAAVAELSAARPVVAVVDEYAAAYLAYETMPPRPVGRLDPEVVVWEQRRLDLERRCYRAARDWSALMRERMALAGGETGEAAGPERPGPCDCDECTAARNAEI